MKTEKKRSNVNRYTRSRRGISLVEVAVALAVITIISAAALSLVISSAKVDANSLRTTQVMMHAENALECFRFADSKDDFLELMKKTGNYYDEDGRYLLSEKNYVVTVTYNEKVLTFKAVDDSGEEIYAYEFTKG